MAIEMQKIVTINGNSLILVVSQQQLAFLAKNVFFYGNQNIFLDLIER